MSRLDEAIAAKKLKRAALEAAGINVHPYTYNKTHLIAAASSALGKNETVNTAGRITALRTQGKVSFLDLTDETGTIQVLLHAGKVGAEKYALISKLDPGDFLGVTGLVEPSKTGETTIMAQDFQILGKALRPLPTAWNTAEDKEARFRNRYLDLLINPRANFIIRARFTILREFRAYMQEKEGYTEVDTPILQPLYGGTNARPFTTHMNALDCDFYLRVAPELYLKRLIVAGYERIFEIARNFRNEGIDQTHQPEFTMVEWYEAYADYRRMMQIIEGLIKHLNQKVNHTDTLMVGTTEVNLNKTWNVYTVHEALAKFADITIDDLSDNDLQKLLDKNNLKLIGAFSRGKATFALFDKLVCNQLIEPTWIIDYPKEVSPLAKQHRHNSDLVERYELYIGGKEISDGWSEITDPLDQRARFENEQQRMRDGDDEAQPLDEEFLEAMEYGLPVLGGVGLGIDRLVMLLTNEWSIRETIAFPTLRPTGQVAKVAKENHAQQTIANLVNPVTKANSGDEKVAFNTDTVKTTFDPQVFTRAKAEKLLCEHVKDKGLLDHNFMVATALEAYAKKLGEDSEMWYIAGVLHDVDYEEHPNEHPLYAVNVLLKDYPDVIKQAIHSHGYGTVAVMEGGVESNNNSIPPVTLLDEYITAVDELSGFLRAVAKVRPNGFSDMKVKSVTKNLKNKNFAAAINRDDIQYGADLIGVPLDEHIAFMIEAFRDFKLS